MSDYIPTTEEVELYFKQAVPEPYGVDLDNAFDRWLAEVKAQVWDDAWKEGSEYPKENFNPYRQGKTE